jgi:hypothetical protein
VLELAGPLAVAALVLAAGGLFKLRDPGPAAAMFRTLGVHRPPATRIAAVMSGIVELVLGVTTFVLGGRVLASATALAFVVFALVAWRLVRMPAGASCGCFGRLSGESTLLHVGIDVAVALVAVSAAVVDAPGFADARTELPGGGLVFGGLALLGGWLVVAALTALPEAITAARRGPATPAVRSFDITGAS